MTEAERPPSRLEARPIHWSVCGVRALGCGPCQLVDGHTGQHLCAHYAANGEEIQ